MLWIGTVLCVTIAAICNAVMDTCAHHFSKSIFNSKELAGPWWNGETSWRNKYVAGDPKNGRRKISGTPINIPVQLTDAFHFFKMWMIIAWVGAIICFPGINSLGLPESWMNIGVWLLSLGAVYNGVFSFFYNTVFIKKGK